MGAAAAFALLQLNTVAWAQAASPADAALEGLRRQEERSRQQQLQLEPKADVLKPAIGQRARPADLPSEERCFIVRELRLQGKDWERFNWIADAAMPYLGRCLGVQRNQRCAGAKRRTRYSDRTRDANRRDIRRYIRRQLPCWSSNILCDEFHPGGGKYFS